MLWMNQFAKPCLAEDSESEVDFYSFYRHLCIFRRHLIPKANFIYGEPEVQTKILFKTFDITKRSIVNHADLTLMVCYKF